MAARRLWLALLVEVAIYIALILLFVPSSARLIVAALIPLAMITLRCGLVLASFASSEPLSTANRLRLPARLRMQITECIAFLRFLLLIMTGPNRDRYLPPSPDDIGDKPLVILLHGIFCNGAVWRPIAARLAARTGCEVRTPTLPRTTIGLANQIDDFAAFLAPLFAKGGREVIVIGHSLGGLIARQCAHRDREHLHIVGLICIGTPHAGSRVARLSFTPIARDVRPSSAALARAGVDSIELLNIHGEHDNLVVPARSCVVPHARNIAIAGCGHMALIYSPTVLEILVREIGNHRSRPSHHTSTFR